MLRRSMRESIGPSLSRWSHSGLAEHRLVQQFVKACRLFGIQDAVRGATHSYRCSRNRFETLAVEGDNRRAINLWHRRWCCKASACWPPSQQQLIIFLCRRLPTAMTGVFRMSILN